MSLLCQAQAAAPQAIYMVMVDRFHNGDPSNDADANPADPIAFHGGDLRGIEQKLGHIQDLGFTQIWMSPIAKMRTEPIGGHGAFHGYWVEDGSRLEPRFGQAEDLEALTAQMDRRGMAPVLDLVTNHVGPDTPLVQAKPQWFHGRGDVVDWSATQQRIPPDVHGLPDLAQEIPEVTQHLIDEAKVWRAGQYPVRLDAVRHLPPSFVRAYRAAISTPTAPAVVYGEIFEGNPIRLAEQAREYGLDHTFDFPLHYALVDVFCRGGDARALATTLSADASYGPGHTHLTFLDNHDLPRIRTACGGDESKVAAAMDLMLALRGTPVVTYGTEAGLAGQTETEARSDMDFSRTAPVAAVIKAGLARRQAHPSLASAPTVIAAATQDSLVMIRPAADHTLMVRWSRQSGVSVTTEVGSDERVPDTPLIVPLEVPQVPLQDGSTLWLSGSSEALGGWDSARAMGPLKPGGTVKLELPWGAAVATKLLIKTEDGQETWADGPNQTHVLGVKTGRPQTQKLRWPAP